MASARYTRCLRRQPPPCLPALTHPAESSAISAATDAAASEYAAGRQRLADAQAVLAVAVTQPQHCLHFLRPGRIVRVTQGALRCAALR